MGNLDPRHHHHQRDHHLHLSLSQRRPLARALVARCAHDTCQVRNIRYVYKQKLLFRVGVFIGFHEEDYKHTKATKAFVCSREP